MPPLIPIAYLVLLAGVSRAVFMRGYVRGRLSRLQTAVVLGLVWASFPWIFGLTAGVPFSWGAAITGSLAMFATMSISFAWLLRRVPRDEDSGSRN